MISTLALAMVAQTPLITVDSLLRDMTDLRRLSERPSSPYKFKQYTSYDRASDNWKDAFANGDAGQFIRDEQIGGRTERVMADVRGPGALVHIWSANPSGTIRFYFDGEATASFSANMKQLLTGAHPLFPDPYAYTAAQGTNLYFPLPYAKGVKVTWEAERNSPPLYFIVGSREYAAGTRVQTFTPASVGRAQRTMAAVTKALTPAPYKLEDSPKLTRVAANGTIERRFTASNGGEIQELEVRLDAPDDGKKAWEDPARRHNVLRQLRLRMSFDGQKTVDVPLGDFFGSAPGIAPHSSLPVSVQTDGRMVARWSMPYRREARIWIENGNAAPVSLSLNAKTANRRFTDGTYLFHARFNAQTKPTMPRYDFTFADVRGEGRWVGTTLQISNPVAAWWGEGDEKVYVDGETFPSLFGTGTEDYFCYAWCDPTPFTRPYHNQPPTPNIGNLGQTINSRYHIVDDIPFTKSIRFDMEAWHWENTNATYATTAFWYARPGSTLPDEPTVAELLIPETPLPKPVEGAIEGESLTWTVTGGRFEMQSGFTQLSSLRQFWWREPQPGAVATTTINVPTAGRYEIVGNFGHNVDYGRFGIRINGQNAKEIDFYQPTLEWKKSSLGTFDLPAGPVKVEIVAMEPNAAIRPRVNLFGLDYFLLNRK